MCSVHKVIIEYVLKTYPATSEHISKVNFNNYINNGFPVESSNKKGYEYLEMTDIDADGFPSDSLYLDSFRDTSAWDVWNAGKWRWNRVIRTKVGGIWRRDMGHNIPLSGGYGFDKHTLVCEFPGHLLRVARAARVTRASSTK